MAILVTGGADVSFTGKDEQNTWEVIAGLKSLEDLNLFSRTC